MPSATQIIYEEPSEDDLFIGGGHNRTSLELVRTIRQLRLRGGAIGLEGAWGAGKSSVIKMAAKQITRSENSLATSRIVVFDLWSYQTDDFRHSLLRRLIDHAREVRPECSEYFDEKLSEINTKTQETERKSDSIYSTPTSYFLIVAPIFPILFSWLGPSYFSNPQTAFNLFGILPIHLAFSLLLGFGYILVLAKGIQEFYHLRRYETKLSRADALKKAVSRSLSVFSKEADRSNSTTSVVEVDPAKNSFHKIFYEIIGKIYESRIDFCFVFDNIDRLQKDSAKEILSSLRMIFGRDEAARYKSIPPTYVVPFDQHHLTSILEIDPENSDLLEKMFDRILRISTPVVTDWQEYLRHCLDKVFFPEIPREEVYKITRIFDVRRQERSTDITPRRIVSFSNDLASHWERWRNDIPLLTIATYVIHRDKFEASSNLVTDIGAVGDQYASMIQDDDWFRNLAAIHYNVDLEHAYQVILRPLIDSALTEPTVDLGQHELRPGFGPVLLGCVAPYVAQWAQFDSPQYFLACGKLGRLTRTSPFVQEAIRDLGAAAARLPPNGPVPSAEQIHDLAEMLGKQQDDRRRSIAVAFMHWLSGVALLQPKSRVEAGQLWILALARTASAAVPESLVGEYIAEVPAPSSPKVVIGLAIGCAEQGIHFRDLNLAVPASGLAEEIVQYVISGGSLAFEICDQLGGAQVSKEASAIALGLANHLVASAAAGDLPTADTIALLAESLSRAGDAAKPIVEQLTPLTLDGALWFMGQNAEPKSGRTALAVVWLTVRCVGGVHVSHVQQHPQYGDLASSNIWYEDLLDAAVSDDDITYLSKWIESSIGLMNWINILVGNAQHNLVNQAVRNVIDREIFNNLGSRAVVQNYQKIKGVLGDEISARFIRNFKRWNRFFPAELKDIVDSIPAVFVEDISRPGVTGYDWVLSAVDASMARLTLEGWNEAVSTDDGNLRKAIARKRSSSVYLPSEPFRSALLRNAQDNYAGSGAEPWNAFDWADAINLLRPRSRLRLASDLYKSFSRIRPAASGIDRFVERYGSLLLVMPLDRNADRTADKVLVPLINSNSPRAGDVLLKLSSAWPPVLRRVGMAARGRLETALGLATNSIAQGRKHAAKALLRQMKAEIKPGKR